MGSAVSPAIRFQADRLRYPGMQLREILIWKNWLYLNSTRFDRYDYNVRLGDGVDPGPSFPESSRRMWIANSMKRVDVVAVKGGHVTLIEVEENPGMTAFGQLAGYQVLWRNRVQAGGPPAVHISLGVERFFPADLPLDPSPGLLLVCARVGNDALAVARSSGVIVEVVPTDFSVLKPQSAAS
jgi:hypothetical protein